MAYQFPSAEWVAAFKDAINANESYRKSAAKWEGDFYFIISPKGPIKEPFVMYLDLWHGECREAHRVTDMDALKPEFVIEGTLAVYKQIFDKKLDPIRALVSRKLKLRGNLSKIMRAVKATLDLVNSAASVDTVYPDES
jgi:putative sterol carrier protein